MNKSLLNFIVFITMFSLPAWAEEPALIPEDDYVEDSSQSDNESVEDSSQSDNESVEDSDQTDNELTEIKICSS